MICITKADTRVKKPRSRVSGAQRARRVHALSARMQKAVVVDLYHGLVRFKKRIPKEKIKQAWESGKYEDLEKFIPWEKFPEDISPAFTGMGEAMMKGVVFGQLPAPINKRLRFDSKNPRIRGYIDKRAGNLISEIQNTQRVRIRRLVHRAFTEALTPKRVADEVVSFIGLHDKYATALDNYQKQLIKSGVKPRAIQKLVDKYEDHLLKARAMTIARTEVHRAVNHGQREVWREAANQDLIDRRTAKRIWVVDGAPCDICEPMDGEETTLDDSFVLEDGTAAEPGDVHPNCFCTEILEV